MNFGRARAVTQALGMGNHSAHALHSLASQLDSGLHRNDAAQGHFQVRHADEWTVGRSESGAAGRSDGGTVGRWDGGTVGR
jgi:hypothetical protein